MKNKIIHENFLEAIRRKISQKSVLTNFLVDILFIEREAVYRRLRGEVPFTFAEVAVISQELGISIDNIIKSSNLSGKSYQLSLLEYINPAESDFVMIEDIVNILSGLKDQSSASGGEITNIIPQPLYLTYENITRFFHFKWKYQYGSPGVVAYKDIITPEKMRRIQIENVKVSKYIDTTYVFDKRMFPSFINDIKYFFNIRLITEKEIKSLKHDLLRLLEDLEEMAMYGCFKETGKKVSFYISDISFESSYCFIENNDFHLMLIKIFILNGVASLEEKVYRKIKGWLEILKLNSTKITGKDFNMQRENYFSEQRYLINSL